MRFKIPARQPRGFARKANYIAGRTDQLSPDRVEWSFGVNLMTDEPDTAAAIMAATAARNTRCQNPAYHLMVAFDPADNRQGKVAPEVMREIAEDIIKRFGLSEYQALVYAHKDTKHPHIHFLINRIHPETGKALSRHNDGIRLHKLCREIALERGLNISRDMAEEFAKEKTRARKERVDDFDATRAPTDGEYWRAKHDEREAMRPFSKDEILGLRKDLRPVFYEASTWGGLSAQLKKNGLELLPKGQGLIITDGTGYLKLSDLHDRELRLPVLNERFGERYEDYSNHELAKFLASQSRDLPPAPKLDGLSKDERARAEAIHRARVKAASTRKALEHHTDLLAAFDAADSELRYWMMIRDNYVSAENRIQTERHRIARQEIVEAKANRNLNVAEGRMSGSIAGYYMDADKAHEKWMALEKDKGSILAAEMVMKKPQVLGRTHHSLFSSFDKRLAAQRALDTMLKRRKRWYSAKERLDGVRGKQQRHYQMLQKHLKDYEHLQRTGGAMLDLPEIIREKIKWRARAMERLTPRMFEHSKIADARLRQLKKSYRDYHEKKRGRDRQRDLDRDLWGDR